MSFTFKPAVRENAPLLIGLGGPSSSGKTMSALRLATGLANGGPIAMIDTENKRALHYADQFEFQHGDLTAPFAPARYMEALKSAAGIGAKVIVVDSMSHEHEGPGGILEMHETALQKMAGDDYGKRERMNFTAWIKPKAEHNRFVNEVLQLGAHVICCFRAKEKIKLVKVNGKTQVVQMGWQPICADRFEYEMTALLMLPPNSQGVPDLSIASTKIQEQHKGIIGQGQQISEDMGQQLAEWAGGGAKADSADWGVERIDVSDNAKEVASGGTEAFRIWWRQQPKMHRDLLGPMMAELKKIAKEADAASEPFDIAPAEPAPDPQAPIEAEPTPNGHMTTDEFQHFLSEVESRLKNVGPKAFEVFRNSDRYKVPYGRLTDKQRASFDEWIGALTR